MPRSHDGFIRLILVQPFVEHVARSGVDPRPALATLGLNQQMLLDPTATVHAEIVYGLCNALADLSRTPHLGSEVGQKFDLSTWPPIAAAATASTAVGGFLINYLMQVPQESSSVKHALTVQADRARYGVSRLVQTDNPPVQVDGFGIALHLRLLQMAMGSAWMPQDVLVETAYPQAVPRGFMGVRLARTEDPALTISFPSDWLNAQLELRASAGLPPPTAKEPDMSIVAALRSAARPLLWDGKLNARDLAQALGLDQRRLEAALRLHQTTAARELKRLKIEIAQQNLADTTLSISEIGQSVGYSDQSHFARFFRSQTGKTPQEYRLSRIAADRG
ncbi:Transcriptional activator NphR [Falsiruegeria litorea R37]|uniref:Transcriptional activator NphR n=1 Tax=Falsiruegeria litorea R37 TaxID=1200284 RepID=A0A1Y5RXA1_9RHOB|nr:AraC family transcriptional regulator [Falsiruegeria litorea]SLN27630.1 Transcriptional activator NphR [Falsiruegeria litorea R37]